MQPWPWRFCSAGWWLWRWRLAERSRDGLPTTGNPTELKTARFGAAYALVLLAAAWLSDFAGNRGLYVLCPSCPG